MKVQHYIIISITMLSCTRMVPDSEPRNRQSDNNERIASNIDPNTIPEIFTDAFQPGYKINVDDFKLKFDTMIIGNLDVHSGEIVFTDYILKEGCKPYIQTVPIGSFPIIVSTVNINNKDIRSAFIKVDFSENEIKKWEFLVTEDQEKMSIYSSELLGIPVDASTAILADYKTISDFIESGKDLYKTSGTKISNGSFFASIYEQDGHRFTEFSTGLGDGFYGTYAGIDSLGNTVSVLIDFGFVPWWEVTAKAK
jgi:hypothetical protein